MAVFPTGAFSIVSLGAFLAGPIWIIEYPCHGRLVSSTTRSARAPFSSDVLQAHKWWLSLYFPFGIIVMHCPLQVAVGVECQVAGRDEFGHPCFSLYSTVCVVVACSRSPAGSEWPDPYSHAWVDILKLHATAISTRFRMVRCQHCPMVSYWLWFGMKVIDGAALVRGTVATSFLLLISYLDADVLHGYTS